MNVHLSKDPFFLCSLQPHGFHRNEKQLRLCVWQVVGMTGVGSVTESSKRLGGEFLLPKVMHLGAWCVVKTPCSVDLPKNCVAKKTRNASVLFFSSCNYCYVIQFH